MSALDPPETLPRLHLPCEDKDEWARVERHLRRPLASWASLDALLTDIHSTTTRQTCTFFATMAHAGSGCSKFDWASFWTHAVPFMIEVALDMPSLFASIEVPLLLKGRDTSVTLTRRQCACLLSHSFFGTITASARRVETKKWAFRASQLFFLQATPSALCLLNYFRHLAVRGVPSGTVTFERVCFPRGSPPWTWEGNPAPLCPVEFLQKGEAIESSPAEFHADFANKFVGGGCLENDYAMEEILFVIKPELIVSMALASHMVDEDAIRIRGALQFSRYQGYSHTFEFDGDYTDSSSSSLSSSASASSSMATPPTVCAMDALQGCAKIQFQEGLVRRDLNKARVAFTGASTVATGNWGCGAFGNDHLLKFLQQWLAASDASAGRLFYHTHGDKRTDGLPELARALQGYTVGDLWRILMEAAKQCSEPGNGAKFRKLMEEKAKAHKCCQT
eukprot:TRINITY_DN14739_c0_g1_i1.p1 TRINITY_DN14739_c0_g1~~TRINITY_DN14739_c0_g1_i1.p1  ORF type:complete len:450 (-),score=86.65 TRINITY_DN14739_c0_g1_i1:20-1369(-)